MKQYLFLLFLFSVCFGFAQTKDSLSVEEQQHREKNIQAGNPFKKFGYKPKIHTLSKGKYLEFHDLDSIVKIGSFSYHVKRKSITGYSLEETGYTEATLRPEIVSRWFSPDPLSDEFPSWSPYNFTNDNPIFFTDPTGLAPKGINGQDDWIVTDKNGYFTGQIIKDDKTHGIQKMNDDGSYERFAFNDQKNDVTFINNYISAQNSYYGATDEEPLANFVQNKYVSNLQKERMSGGKSIWGARHIYAYAQSLGGRMDGVQFIFPDFLQGKLPDKLRNSINGKYPGDVTFFIHNGSNNQKAYNFHDFGNYNWGGAMFELGFQKNNDLEYILSKARKNGTGDSSESNEDQQAIRDGYIDAKKRNGQ